MIHMAIEKEKGRRKANKLPPWLSEADLWSLFADVPDCDIQQGDQEELLISTHIQA